MSAANVGVRGECRCPLAGRPGPSAGISSPCGVRVVREWSSRGLVKKKRCVGRLLRRLRFSMFILFCIGIILYVCTHTVIAVRVDSISYYYYYHYHYYRYRTRNNNTQFIYLNNDLKKKKRKNPDNVNVVLRMCKIRPSRVCRAT